MTDDDGESPKPRPEDVAAYIAVLTTEMVRLARSHSLSELAYLLDVARMEARHRSPAPAERNDSESSERVRASN